MEFSDLAGLAGAHAQARAIQVALKLGMFEALAERALDADALAAAIGCDPARHGVARQCGGGAGAAGASAPAATA